MEPKKCQFCGNELDEGGVFCGFCGAKLSNVKTISIVTKKKEHPPINKRILFGVIIGLALIGLTVALLVVFTKKPGDSGNSSEPYPSDYSTDTIIHPDTSMLSIPGDSSFTIPDAIRAYINTQAEPSDYLSDYSGYTATMAVLYNGAETAEQTMQSNEYSQEEITAFLEEYSRNQNLQCSGTVSLSSTVIEVSFPDYQTDAIRVWDTEAPIFEYEPGIYRAEEVTDHIDGSTFHCKTVCFLNDGSIFAQFGTSETISGEQLLSKEVRILLTPFEEKRPEHHSASQGSSSDKSTNPNDSTTENTSLPGSESETEIQNQTESSSEASSENVNTSATEKETSISPSGENNGNIAYHTDEIPGKDEFAWYLNDIKKNGVWSDSTPITDFTQLTGGWKCSIIYNRSETITMDCREDVNLEISGSASTVNAYIHWGTLYIEGEDPVDETYIDDTVMSGTFQNGFLDLTGPCDIQFTQFFTKDKKQYAVGTLSSSEGESAVVILVRP